MPLIKGSQMLGVVKPLRALRSQAQGRIAAHLETYFEERLLVANWYPEEDFRDLVILLGRLVGPKMDDDPWRMIGLSGADRDFNGIYSAMIRVGDTAWTINHMPEGWGLYRDTGRLTVSDLADGRAEIVLSDFPVMGPELAEVTAGYFHGALIACAASEPKVTTNAFDANGARWRLTWQSS